jgi:hypothetical protein
MTLHDSEMSCVIRSGKHKQPIFVAARDDGGWLLSQATSWITLGPNETRALIEHITRFSQPVDRPVLQRYVG